MDVYTHGTQKRASHTRVQPQRAGDKIANECRHHRRTLRNGRLRRAALVVNDLLHLQRPEVS